MRNSGDEIDEYDDDYEEDSDDGYIPCPHCGETMLEAADYCPSCNRWITSEEVPERRLPKWVVIIATVLLGMMIFSVLRF